MPVLAVPDHRDLVLEPLQHPLDRPFVRSLDHQMGLLTPERPQEVDRRLRPEHEVHTRDRDPAPEGSSLERLLRRVARGEPPGLPGRGTTARSAGMGGGAGVRTGSADLARLDAGSASATRASSREIKPTWFG